MGASPAAVWGRGVSRGFTLIELLVVIAIVAIGAGVVSLSLRDPAASQLDEEGARLVALLEGARAESRAGGLPVRWVPGAGDQPGASRAAGADPAAAFRFVGLPAGMSLPTHWLAPGVSARVVGGTSVLLGPDAILPPQRILLSLGDRRVEVSTDGLNSFAVTFPREDSP